MKSLVEQALILAVNAHHGQLDKAGMPYILHVMRVAHACADDPATEIVAWLHDVVEDCPDFRAELYELLPISLLEPVLLLSRNVELPELGELSKDYYGRILTNPIAVRVKLADIADNASEERLQKLDLGTANRLRAKYALAKGLLTALSDQR